MIFRNFRPSNLTMPVFLIVLTLVPKLNLMTLLLWCWIKLIESNFGGYFKNSKVQKNEQTVFDMDATYAHGEQ